MFFFVLRLNRGPLAEQEFFRADSIVLLRANDNALLALF
jgi:hypothetical protein